MERLNQWLTLVANFGVVIGIVFLAYEMRLNTDAMRSGTAAQMVTNWNSITQDLATTPELIAAISKVNEDGFQAEPAAQSQSFYLASSMYRSFEYEFLEALRGNVDEQVWRGHIWSNRAFIADNPYMLSFWGSQRNGFALSFRDFLDDLIRDICSKQACPEGGRPEDWTDVST